MERPEDGAGPLHGVTPGTGARPEAESAAARVKLEQVCTLLLDPIPEHLDRSAELLAEAVNHLSAWSEASASAAASRSGRQAVEVRQLRSGLARARRLLEAAAEFHAGWVSCAGALCAGYTRCGQPGLVAHNSRLWAQG